MVRCLQRLCDPGNPAVSQRHTWRTCHFRANPGQVNWVVGMWVRTVNTALLRILTTFLVMGKSSRAFNSAKNIAAIRTQIVKDMGLDHLPDIRHVSMVGEWAMSRAGLYCKLCQRHNGPKALSTLTPLIQIRDFNKL